MNQTYCRLINVDLNEKNATFKTEENTSLLIALPDYETAENMSIALAISDEPLYYFIDINNQQLMKGDDFNELYD